MISRVVIHYPQPRDMRVFDVPATAGDIVCRWGKWYWISRNGIATRIHECRRES